MFEGKQHQGKKSNAEIFIAKTVVTITVISAFRSKRRSDTVELRSSLLPSNNNEWGYDFCSTLAATGVGVSVCVCVGGGGDSMGAEIDQLLIDL